MDMQTQSLFLKPHRCGSILLLWPHVAILPNNPVGSFLRAFSAIIWSFGHIVVSSRHATRKESGPEFECDKNKIIKQYHYQKLS